MTPEQQIEQWCDIFYGQTTSQEERAKAHELLMPIQDDSANVNILKSLLSSTTNDKALAFAATGLTKMYTKEWRTTRTDEKERVLTFLYDYITKDPAALYQRARVAVGPLLRLLCTVTKLAWLDDTRFQNVNERVGAFMYKSTVHSVLALELYTELTVEMQPTSALGRDRRIASAFRDGALEKIYETGLDILKKLARGEVVISDPNEEHHLKRQVLKLCVNCMAFDFNGSLQDDSSEEQSAVMLPHQWTCLLDPNVPKLFFEVYNISVTRNRVDCAVLVLQYMVHLASIRKSYFSSHDGVWTQVLDVLMRGTAGILEAELGTQNEQCYHEMCRVISKINIAQNLNEINFQTAQSWFEQVFNFTVATAQDTGRSSASMHFLLKFWAGLVVPCTYYKEKMPPQTVQYIQQVATTFVTSRLVIAEDDMDETLVDDVLRTEQLDVLSQMCRIGYSIIGTHLINKFQEVLDQGVKPGIERKWAWLVYLAGAMCKCSISQGQRGDLIKAGDQVTRERVIGELAYRVFLLVDYTDNTESIYVPLESSYLYFMDAFRRTAIQEHAAYSSEDKRTVMASRNSLGGMSNGSMGEDDTKDAVEDKTQQENPDRICRIMKLSDEDEILGKYIIKIGKNLQKKFREVEVTQKTLQLFQELASGVSVVHTSGRCPVVLIIAKLLLHNSTVQYLLEHHADDEFKFLHHDQPKYGVFRTPYYQTLGKLMMHKLEGEPLTFQQFLRPQELNCQQLMQLPNLRVDQAKLPLIALSRDLRGLCMAINNKSVYTLFFEWLVEDPRNPDACKITLFSKAIDQWWDDHTVTTPILKFLCEFCHNRSSRIHFEASSPNGIVLFREACKILTAYGQRILQQPATVFKDIYRQRHKGISLALTMFNHCLDGKYANFGIFELYGDQALVTTMNLAMQKALSTPISELVVYQKAMKPIYNFLIFSTKEHMNRVCSLEAQAAEQFLHLMEEGFVSLDKDTTTKSCSAVEYVCQYLYDQKDKQNVEGKAAQAFLHTQSEKLVKLLQVVLQVLTCGSFEYTYQLSRPMFGLVVLFPQQFTVLKEQYVASRLPESQAMYQQLFENIFNDVEPKMIKTHQDKFTSNLYGFMRSFRGVTNNTS